MTNTTPAKFIKNKNLILLFTGNLVSQFGNWLYFLAIIFLVQNLTNSYATTGFALAINSLPKVLLSNVAGIVCDRFSRKKILIYSDIINGILSLYIGIKLLTVGLNIYEVYIVAFLIGIGRTFFNPAFKASIPNIAAADELNRVNSLFNSSTSITDILGPICGGVIITILGLPLAFIINGISFLISAINEIFVVIPQEFNNQGKFNIFFINKGVKLGYIQIYNNKILLIIISIFSIMTFFAAPMILFFKELSSSYYNVGYIGFSFLIIADGIGVLAAHIYLIIKPNNKYQKQLLCLFPMIGGITLLIIANLHNFALAITILMLQGIVSGFGEISLMTIIQKETPDKNRGMVFSAYAFISAVLHILSLVIAGVIMEFVSINIIISVCGIPLIIGSFILFSKFKKHYKSQY